MVAGRYCCSTRSSVFSVILECLDPGFIRVTGTIQVFLHRPSSFAVIPEICYQGSRCCFTARHLLPSSSSASIEDPGVSFKYQGRFAASDKDGLRPARKDIRAKANTWIPALKALPERRSSGRHLNTNQLMTE